LNFFGIASALGGTTATLTDSTMRGELRRQGTVMNARLISAAEKAGVDLEELRKAIRNGETPEMAIITAMSTSLGKRSQGDTATIDASKASEAKRIIASLNQG
jgi:hypothetical protein